MSFKIVYKKNGNVVQNDIEVLHNRCTCNFTNLTKLHYLFDLFVYFYLYEFTLQSIWCKIKVVTVGYGLEFLQSRGGMSEKRKIVRTQVNSVQKEGTK